jgi:hypothetical protein
LKEARLKPCPTKKETGEVRKEMATSATPTAAERERQQYQQVVSLINGNSASSITKKNKEYLETIFNDEDEEGSSVNRSKLI